MINQELSLYIQAQLASGMPKDVIKEILIARGGWHPEDVEQAFTAFSPAPAPMTQAPTPAPVIAPEPKIEPVVQQSAAQTNFFAPKTSVQAPVQPVMSAPTPITPAPMPATPVMEKPMAQVQPAVSPFLKPSPTNPLPQTAPAPVIQPQMQAAPAPASIPTQTISPAPAPAPTPIVAQSVMSDITFVKGSLGSPEPVSTAQPKMATPTEATPTMLASQMEKNQISSSPIPAHSQVAPTTTMSALSQVQSATPPVGFIGMNETPSSQSMAPQTPVQSFVGMQTHTQQVQQMQQMNDGVQITEKKPRSKLAKVIIGLVILLVLAGLGGGAAYGYFYYVNPSPARAFAAVIPKFKSAQTGHYKATITATFNKNAVDGLIPAPTGLTPDQGVAISQDTTAQGTFTIDGTFDKTDAKNPKSSNTLTIGTTAIPLSITLETRLIGETLYAKVPDLGFLADLLGGNTFGFVPGDWVELSKSEAMTASQIDPMLSALLPTQATTNTVATNAQQDQLVSAFFDSGVITPTVELAKGTVGTTSVHRYQFSVDQQALKTALTKAYTSTTGATGDNSMITSAIGQFVDGMTVQNGELWVGVWDGKPYRIMFTVKPTGDFANQLQSVAFDINFDSFGQPVTITTPVGAKSLMSLIQDAQKKMKDTKIQANLTAVKTRAELYYSVKRTYLGLCSADAGLKTQFASLTNITAPGGVYCKDSARAFAVAAELTTPQSVACVDNTNSVTLMPALPTALACK